MQIAFQKVSYSYQPNEKKVKNAIDEVSLLITQGEYICITGPTGSGKSTLLQHINGLLKPTAGKVYVDEKPLAYKGKEIQRIRERIGFLFQFPENQLFEDTIEKDICFGPKKMGLDMPTIIKRIPRVMDLVGLSYEEMKDRSPLQISGGQRRRVALACILITNPDVLLLDEPTVGLDPKGKQEILALIKRLNQQGKTVIMITHEVEDIAVYAKRLLLFDEGKVAYDGTPRQIIPTRRDLGIEHLIPATQAVEVAEMLRNCGWRLPQDVVSWQDLESNILPILKESN